VAPLEEYQAKRDFHATPEPSGAAAAEAGAGGRFVIQQHSATRLHWDLRLERDGVLVSWALPRGVPWSPDDNHLAVHTEDHPLEYLTFHGHIPEGEYGGGDMFVWDTGTYDTVKWDDNKVIVELRGEQAQGRYALFQTRGRDWMIHRMDPPADPERQKVPEFIAPMWPRHAARVPKGDGWVFELLWTGMRAVVTSSSGVVVIHDAEASDVSRHFPEIRRLGRAVGSTEVVLDGVVTDPGRGHDGVQRRLSLSSDSAIRRDARDHPALLVAFDLLWLDGYDKTNLSWEERRALLDGLGLDGEAWQAPKPHRGDGALLLDAARAQGLPGLVAKRAGSRYVPGSTTDDWRALRA
jgi:bifunctional non-homologous end joining protein LigD